MEDNKTYFRNYAIYKQYLEGKKISYLAEKYGMIPSNVTNIVGKLRDMESFYPKVGGRRGFTDEVKAAIWATHANDKTTNRLIRFVKALKRYDLETQAGGEQVLSAVDRDFVLAVDELAFLDIPGTGVNTYDSLIQLKKYLKEGKAS